MDSNTLVLPSLPLHFLFYLEATQVLVKLAAVTLPTGSHGATVLPLASLSAAGDEVNSMVCMANAASVVEACSQAVESCDLQTDIFTVFAETLPDKVPPCWPHMGRAAECEVGEADRAASALYKLPVQLLDGFLQHGCSNATFFAHSFL